MKGRFFQALHTKWQRKLEKQSLVRASVSSMTEQGPWRDTTSNFQRLLRQARSESLPQVVTSPPRLQSGVRTVPRNNHRQLEGQLLVVLHELGRKWSVTGARTYARDCPSRGSKSESPGQSTSRLAALTATPIESGNSLNSFSVEQLEQHLAQRRLSSETTQMQSASQGSAGVGVVLSESRSPTSYILTTRSSLRPH